jgi:hypothetical protein
MRWMESLLERTGAGNGLPTIQRLWTMDRDRNSTRAYRWYLLRRTLNFVLALVASSPC